MVWALSLLSVKLIPHVLTPVVNIVAFGVWLDLEPRSGPYSIQCSTATTYTTRLALKLFRGEPAITKFDWPFTPIHSSSRVFSTTNSSGLHPVLPELHPVHG